MTLLMQPVYKDQPHNRATRTQSPCSILYKINFITWLTGVHFLQVRLLLADENDDEVEYTYYVQCDQPSVISHDERNESDEFPQVMENLDLN